MLSLVTNYSATVIRVLLYFIDKQNCRQVNTFVNWDQYDMFPSFISASLNRYISIVFLPPPWRSESWSLYFNYVLAASLKKWVLVALFQFYFCRLPDEDSAGRFILILFMPPPWWRDCCSLYFNCILSIPLNVYVPFLLQWCGLVFDTRLIHVLGIITFLVKKFIFPVI